MAFTNTTIIDDTGNEIATISGSQGLRLKVEADLAPGASVNTGQSSPAQPSNLIRKEIDSSGSTDLSVDGSGTPVEFIFTGSSDANVRLSSIRFVMTANSTTTDGESFGPLKELANGLQIQTRISDSVSEAGNLKITEDFLTLPTPDLFLDRSGKKEVLASSFTFGGAVTLNSGSGEWIKVRVRDDLSGNKFELFKAIVTATKTK